MRLIYNLYHEVPEDWQERKISSFAREINQRYSKDKDGPVLSVTKYKGFVKSREYFKRQIYSKDITKYKLVEKGEFAYATIHLDEGSLGLLRKYDCGYVSPMYTVFRTDSSINSDFLLILLRSEKYLQIYKALGEGSINRRKAISFDSLSQLSIPLPTLEEQNKISLILSNINLLIQNIDQIINYSQRLKKALMWRLLTRGIGHVKFKKIEWFFEKKTEIPEMWESVFLKDIVLSYRNGIYKTPEYYGRGLPSIRMFNIVDGRITVSGAPLLDVTEEELADYGLKVGDIVVNRVNGNPDLVGKTGIVKEDLGKVTFESKNIRIRILQQKCLPEFLAHFMNTDLYYRQIRSLIKGILQSTINQQDLDMIRVPLPQIPEQQKIVSILSTIDLKITTELKHSFYYQNLKKGLMRELLTGKIRVKV